jgi:hypothetical protein
MRFRQAHIPRSAQIKGPHPLRNGCLNPSPKSISLLESFATLPLSCGLERSMLGLWPDDERSARVSARRTNTIAQTRARAAISRGKLDLDQVRMALAAEPAPTGTRFSLWTGRLSVFPIKDKLTRINARSGMGLPLRVNGDGTNHLNPQALLTADQHPSACIPCIDKMLCG